MTIKGKRNLGAPSGTNSLKNKEPFSKKPIITKEKLKDKDIRKVNAIWEVSVKLSGIRPMRLELKTKRNKRKKSGKK